MDAQEEREASGDHDANSAWCWWLENATVPRKRFGERFGRARGAAVECKGEGSEVVWQMDGRVRDPFFEHSALIEASNSAIDGSIVGLEKPAQGTGGIELDPEGFDLDDVPDSKAQEPTVAGESPRRLRFGCRLKPCLGRSDMGEMLGEKPWQVLVDLIAEL